jgi:hypothetical protein
MKWQNLVFQFKISLQEITPTIWRRIQVPAKYSFWDFHVAIQDSMGWFDYHSDYFFEPGMTVTYEYDIGDGWLHEILFEGILLKDKAVKYPWFIDGQRACPPEDCGGAWGYCNLCNYFFIDRND